jgi:hypothetical protein
MSHSKRRRPFVITMVALASTTKLACGSTSEDDDPLQIRESQRPLQRRW